jgi:hypothetical protein
LEIGPDIGILYKANDVFTASIKSKNDFSYKNDDSKNHWNSSVYLFASIPIGAGKTNSKQTKQDEKAAE